LEEAPEEAQEMILLAVQPQPLLIMVVVEVGLHMAHYQ
jgi:hypothetical protein